MQHSAFQLTRPRRYALLLAAGGCAAFLAASCGDPFEASPQGASGASGAAGTAGAAGGAGAAGSAGPAGSAGADASADTSDADAAPAPDADAAQEQPVEVGIDAPQEPVCDTAKSPSEEPCLLDDAYGIFVSPGGTDQPNCGSKNSPCQTLGAGIARAHTTGKSVYACADIAPYDELVAVNEHTDGLKMYGGFTCAGWLFNPSLPTEVKPQVPGPALKISGLLDGLLIEDFSLTSASATAPGDSSVAIAITNSKGVVLRRARVQAGDGALGTKGQPGTNGADGAPPAAEENGKNATCTNPQTGWGGNWPGGIACGSLGGSGGSITQGSPTPHGGSPGIPDTNVTPSGVMNGGSAASNLGSPGGVGGVGSLGNSGENGPPAADLGVFLETGYTPADGGTGTDGYPGQGGGGGGASMSISGCVGASGGAGGMGGCLGTKGSGGSGGGASVAILSWDSEVTLDACVVKSATGGVGGAGGPGGAGGKGGKPGAGGTAGDGMEAGGGGGTGGHGGPGGSGAGGTGGPSFGIVHKGTAPAALNGTTVQSGSGGDKGAGGQAAGYPPAPDGQVGAVAPVHEQS